MPLITMQTISLQEGALSVFLEENKWVSGASISRPAIGEPVVHFTIEISPAGHDLIRDHGMQTFEQKIQAKLSAKDLQGCGWTPGSVGEEIWGQSEARLQQAFPRVLSWIDDFPNHRVLVDVSPDMSCFKGHFPGNPILAGVTQLHWAVCISRFVYGFDEVPGEVKRLKFKNIVTPPRMIELALNKVSENEVQFEFASLGQVHSEGRLIFDGEIP